MKKLIKSIFCLTLTAVLAVTAVSCSNDKNSDKKISKPFEYSGYTTAEYDDYSKKSQYVEVSDGTKLAVDIYLPKGSGSENKAFPVIFQYTPYGRSYSVPDELSLIEKIKLKVGTGTSGPTLDRANSNDTVYGSSGDMIQKFLSYGYAYVCADIRGTGASYGVKKDFMPEIATDGKELIDWIAKQEWSDGNVGMFGGSYLGYSQLVVAGQKPEALKCIIPEVVPLDGYSGEIRPGGILLAQYSEEDQQTYLEMNYYLPDGYVSFPTTPVIDEDGDGDYADEIPLDLNNNGSFLDDYKYPEDPNDEPQYRDGNKREHIYYMATNEHKDNVPYNDVSSYAPYIDSEVDFGNGDIKTAYDVGPAGAIEAIMESGIPIYNHGSWMDAFARGTTELYATTAKTNHSKMIMDVGYHETYSPFWEYCGEDEDESIEAYAVEWLRFFDRYLKGIENGIDTEPPVYIYNMNGDGWRAENEWPLARQKETEYYFNPDNTLSVDKGTDGSDKYKVDTSHNSSFESSWSESGVSRWVMSEPDEIPDRTELDEKCLTYTTATVTEDTEVTGYPIVDFWASSTSSDADFHIYMEDIDEDGNAVLVTEGVLRAGFAKLYDNNNMVNKSDKTIDILPDLPWHGYEKNQYNETIFANNNIVNLTVDLMPTSWTFKEGHSIRISIACVDYPTFENNKAVDENTVVTIYRDSKHPSKVTLPVIPE